MTKRNTDLDCINLALKEGGKFLSEVYLGSHDKYKWQCSKGHIWNSSYTSVQQGSWCPWCSMKSAGERKRNTIEDCIKIAKRHGGMFLSKNYITAFTLYEWQCSKGHIWKANYNNVQSKNRWCPFCFGNIKKTIEDCYKLARKNNGHCLSIEYKNNSTKLTWECEKEHIWQAHYNNIKNGRWCPKCKISRTRQTVFNKHGVEHNSQVKEIALKIAKSQKRSYILNHWKTNEKLICVGSYEKKVVEYFNKNKINFLWQPKVFSMPFLTKAKFIKTYRPDCYLPDNDLWVEVKGYMRNDAKEKWDWFHKEYPNSELWNEKKLKEMRIL